MDLNNFDKQLKSSLENLEVPYDASSWSALDHRMSSIMTEEQPPAVEPVDLVVKRMLERIEVPYQAADWNLLNSRLNSSALVKRIRISKISEAALFLLLLVNIEGFLGGFREVLKPTAPPVPTATVPMANARQPKMAKHQASLPEAAASASPLDELTQLVVSFVAAPFEASLTPGANTIDLGPLESTTTNTTISSVLDAKNFYGTSGFVQFQKLAPLPQAKTPDFVWKNFFDQSIPGVIIPASTKSNGMYGASFVSFEKNEFRSSDYATRENGYGGGIAVGYRKGKWGIETGLAYSNKNFTPKRAEETYAGNPIAGFLGVYVKNVDADVFSVPVKVTRRIAKVGKTSAHGTVGLTANVATEKRYASKIVAHPPSSPDPQPAPDPASFPIPTHDSKGFLEGGSWRTNAYTTADLGLRIEQPLGKRYIAFLEPAYHHALSGGFGPNHERVNTVSFRAGVMASL